MTRKFHSIILAFSTVVLVAPCIAAELQLLDGTRKVYTSISYDEDGAVLNGGTSRETRIFWNLIDPGQLAAPKKSIQWAFIRRYLEEAREKAHLDPERASSIIDGLRPLMAKLPDNRKAQLKWEPTIAFVESAVKKAEATDGVVGNTGDEASAIEKLTSFLEAILQALRNPKENGFVVGFVVFAICVLIATCIFFARVVSRNEDMPFVASLVAGWPLLLVFVGGLIGGLCGGAAFGLSRWMFRTFEFGILTCMLSLFIGVAAVTVWIFVAGGAAVLMSG